MEKYLDMSHKLYGLSSIGLRFFNVFGPRQDPTNPYSGVISLFIDQLTAGKKIMINGGHQTRDFVYVLDVVEVIKKSIALVTNQPIYETVNVLSGNSYSIDELVNILAKLTRSNPQIERKLLQKGDPEKSEGTFKKMFKLFELNTKNFTPLELGLKKIIDNIA